MGGAPVQNSVVEDSPTLYRQRVVRTARLCREAVDNFRIDLRGLRVLTEAATGPYATTAVLAALGGADEVIAVTRSSRWGQACDAVDEVKALAVACGCGPIRFEERPPAEVAAGCDIVTNTGFVRPISERLIAGLANGAAVALMWEPWEFRSEDIDAAALKRHEVALVGTNESHPLIRTMDYLGPSAARLLLELGIEIVGARLLVVGSDPFGSSLRSWFAGAGSIVCSQQDILGSERAIDALVYAEHRLRSMLFAGSEGQQLKDLMVRAGAPVIRISGELDLLEVTDAGITVVPHTDVPHGVMAVTTAYAGPRPVIDLHAGGLRVAADVVRARRSGASVDEAIVVAEAEGFGAACHLPESMEARQP